MTSAPASAASDHPTMLTRMLPLLILAAAVALVFLPLLANMIATGSDYPPHIGWAASTALCIRSNSRLAATLAAAVSLMSSNSFSTAADSALVSGHGGSSATAASSSATSC